MKTQKIYLLISLLAILTMLLCTACGGGEKKVADIENDNPEIVIEKDESLPKDSDKVTRINNENGDEIISIEINNSETVIKYNRGQETLSGRYKRSEKGKYYDQKGNLVAETKYKPESVKLNDSNGKLLWKIKFKEGKIKISDNEEGESPFEIKENEAGKYKIKLGEEQIVEAKLKNNQVTINGKGIFTLAAKKNHPAYAVLGLGQISETHRLIIVAELLKRI